MNPITYDRRLGVIDQYPVIDLFPYRIQDVQAFIHRDHIPYKEDNLESTEYARKVWRNSTEGLWVRDGDTPIWMPPKLFTYINLGTIDTATGDGEKDRTEKYPDLRDNEWIGFTYILCCDGFSGFSEDPDFTCNVRIRDIEEGRELPSKTLKRLENHCKRSNGTWKKYVEAWDYLTWFYNKENPSKIPLGKALYENSSYNGLWLASRKFGKTYMLAGGDATHEFWVNGAMSYESLKKKLKVNMMLGASDSKYIKSFMEAVRVSFTNIPGGGLSPHPLFTRTATNDWGEKKGIVEQKFRREDGTFGGSRSQFNKAVIEINSPEVVVSTRSKRIYVDEIGLLENSKAVFGAADATLKDQYAKFGILFGTGCVCKGTKVWNNKGDLINIEDINKDGGILGYDSNMGIVVPQHISCIQPPSAKPCYRLTTDSGRVLECSEDHPIYTRRRFNSGDYKLESEWVRTDELRLRDGIAVADRIDIWSNRRMFDPRLVGILIGDGTYGSGQNATLANADQDIWNYINIRYSTVEQQVESITTRGDILKKRRILGILEELTKLGLRGQTKINKRLPVDVNSYSREDVCELLGGYFDSDGCVYYDPDTGYSSIKVTSISRELIYDVFLLLNKLGIHGKIRVESPRITDLAKGKYPTYNLYIKDRDSVIEFYKNIKFLVKNKQYNLEMAYLHKLKNTKTKRSKKYVGLRFEKLVKVEYIGNQFVYNLTADGTNTYLANGIQTHNTGGNIEKIVQTQYLFENPKEFDIYSIPNYWSDNKPIALFGPASYTLIEYKDENGNTDLMGATAAILDDRNKTSGGERNKQTNKRLNEPLVVSEMFLAGNSDVFDKDAILNRIEVLNRGEFDKKAKVVDLQLGAPYEYNGMAIYDVITIDKPQGLSNVVREYNNQHTKTGEIVIFEDYIGDGREFLEYNNLYKVVLDPKTDLETGESYMSVIVWKGRPQRALESGEMFHNIVATAKLKDGDFKPFLLLCLKYRSKGQYERNVNGIPDFFTKFGLQWLLQPTPIAYIKDISPGTRQSQQSGIYMTDQLRREATKLLQRMHKSIVHIDGLNRKFKHCETWYALDLLYEMVAYDDERNFDCVSAMRILMLWMESEFIPEDSRYYEENIQTDVEWEDMFQTAKRILA